MSPLDAALARLGLVTLSLLKPSLAERAERARVSPGGMQEGEAERVADEVDRLAGVLAKAG